MIDGEVKIFNRVHGKVSSVFAKNKFVSTVITKKPTSFPAGSLIEMSNTTVRSAQTSTPVENRSRIMYQLEVFDTTKAGCRAAFAAVDDEMISMNFTRISGDFINNFDNTEVFRYVARYEAEIDPDGNLYRRA